MIAINFSTARGRLKDFCDRVTDRGETVIVTRKAEKNVVIISEERFNELEKAERNAAYLGKLEKKGSVLPSDLDGYMETHWIDHILLRNDSFQDFTIDRAKKLLDAIEAATGRTVSGRDSDEVQQVFGASLN